MDTFSPLPPGAISWDLFKWVIGGMIGAFSFLWVAIARRLWSLPDRLRDHTEHDDERFDHAEARFAHLTAQIEKTHQEGRADMQQFRGDIITGQRDLATEMRSEMREMRAALMRKMNGGGGANGI